MFGVSCAKNRSDHWRAKGTLTVRHLPADVDAAIAAQAKAAGRSKSDFIQEVLSASFGDIIGNFRAAALVALMDQELSGVTGLPLTENWYDAGRTLAENREYCPVVEHP
jgi:plasmid stability protein